MAVKKQTAPGLFVAGLSRSSVEELFVTSVMGKGEQLQELFEKALATVRRKNATILAQDIFIPPSMKNQVTPALSNACGGIDWPVTTILNATYSGAVPSATQIHAVAAQGGLRRIELDGQIVGSVFQDDFGRHCRLAGINSTDVSSSRTQQARRVFEKIEAALHEGGMEFSNVIRTWLWLDDILAWYGRFNKVRNDFFTERNVYDGLVPASTGMGGKNRVGAALIADAYAVQPRDESVQAFAVPSPLQCPALEYGSSFSRAVELKMPDHRRLFISGTASVGRDGKTVHLDDVPAQIGTTMKVVGAILESRRMNWTDVTRAVAYVKHAKDTPAFTDYWAQNSLDDLPVVIAENDICRDNLLFEIEVDAVSTE